MWKVFSLLVVLSCTSGVALSASEDRGVLTRYEDSCGRCGNQESSIKRDVNGQDSLSIDPSAGTCQKKKKKG
jgi:hypothetical protein